MKVILRILLLIVLNLVFYTSLVLAEEESFIPTYNFYGDFQLEMDSYFGNYPVITEKNREAGGYNEEEFNDIKKNFPLTNPTRPNVIQYITLNFYTNPLPDIELFIKTKYGGAAGTGAYLSWEQFYGRYYTERAMYTLGRFEPEFGTMGLLITDPFDGLMVNTQWKNTWITLFSSREKMYYYAADPRFPYVSEGGTDDIAACRFSRKYGDNLIGLNLLLDSFYDEKALSFDFNGKIMGHSVTGELGFVYPNRFNRNIVMYKSSTSDEDESSEEYYVPEEVQVVDKGVYPGAVISMNLIESPQQMLRLTLGGMHGGFRTQFGAFAMLDMEDTVKFGRNLWGADLLYKRPLREDLILSLGLTKTDYIDKKFFNEYQKPLPGPFPTRICGVKLTKQISATSELSLTLTYLGDHTFDYGKIGFNWKTFF